MSLVFGGATSDRITLASPPASLTNLTAWSWLFWVYPTTITNQMRLYSRLTGASQRHNLQLNSASGDIRMPVQRGSVDGNTITNTGVLTTNTWQFIAGTYDETDGPRIFRGTLASTVAECSYATNTVGSGATDPDTGSPLYICNSDLTSQSFTGSVAIVSIVTRRMTLAELIAWQYDPRAVNGTKLLYRMGASGTTTQVDWSGASAAGAITGATLGADVPLGPWFAWDTFGSYAGAASTFNPAWAQSANATIYPGVRAA